MPAVPFDFNLNNISCFLYFSSDRGTVSTEFPHRSMFAILMPRLVTHGVMSRVWEHLSASTRVSALNSDNLS